MTRKSRAIKVFSAVLFAVFFFSFSLVGYAKTSDNSSYYTYNQTTYGTSTITYVQTSALKPKLVATTGFDSVKELTKSVNGVIGINAGAWNNYGALDFTYTNGVWYSDNKNAYVGDPLVCTADGYLFAYGYNGASKEVLESFNPTWVVTGFNGVIYDTYYKNVDWNTKHNRSFIGQFADGSYVVGVGTAMTYQDMYDFAKSTWGDSLRLLYNLDGGGSTNLYVDGTMVASGRNVKNAICFVAE